VTAAATGALVAGSVQGDRRSARDLKVDRTVPPWRSWRNRSRASRCIRWIETYCRVPSGVGYGEPLRLAPFQKRSIEVLLARGVRTGGLQIPRGNAKSTLWSAVGLWALCDHDDSPQVPLVASTAGHALRTLFRPARTMIDLEPELSRRLVVYSSSSDRRIWSAWNDGELLPLPAHVDRLQGLNPTVALVDEAQTVPLDVQTAIAQGAGKRAASLVLSIGTPSPDGKASALFDLRTRAGEGARIAWIEYAAEPGCRVDDRREWRRANPGIAAGFLFVDVLEDELSTVPEAAFRMYRLGQWTDYTETGWLPPGAWDALPHVDVPPDGTEIVLGLAGTWTSSIALVGATLDGAVFLAWCSDSATDDDLEDTISAAWTRWTVRSLVVAPRTRAALVRRLTDGGLPLEVWPARLDLEVSSSTEFRRAIVEARIAHDHHPVLAEHVGAVVGTAGPDGSLRLGAPADGREVDAARAARMAWWRAVESAETPAPAIY
jgi:phage terminase large subunit-like protein